MNHLSKIIGCALLLLNSIAGWCNESLTGPSWLNIRANGCFNIDDIMVVLGVNNGMKGANETEANCKFECCPDTIELDSRIWQCKFCPFSEGPTSIIQKKLTVMSETAINWRYTFLAADNSNIRGVGVDISLPAQECDIVIDDQKLKLPAKFSKYVVYKGKCRKFSIPTTGSMLEFSGDFELTIWDNRKWKSDRFVINFPLKMVSPGWKKGETEFDMQYRGIRISRQAFKQTQFKFVPLSLAKNANSTTWDDVADDGKCGWTDKGPDDDLRLFRLKGQNLFDEIPFDIIDPAQNNGKNIVSVSHRNMGLKLPESVDIPLNNVKAGGLYFLHAAAWANACPGYYVVHYADGTSVEIPLRNFDAIFNWWTIGISKSAAVGWLLNAKEDSGKGLGLYPWPNPHPEKAITSITIKIADNANKSMLMLAGITAVDRRPVIPEEEGRPPVDDSHWIPFEPVDEKAAVGTILDASDMVPAPAGKFGFVRVDGDKFRFANGMEARFMGMCTIGFLQAEKPYISTVVKKMRRLGVNIVRVGVGGDEDGGIFQKGGHMEFNPKKLDLFFFYLAELKNNGIYVQLDLLPSRTVKEFEDPALAGVKWYPNVFVMPQIRNRQKDLITILLKAVNPYTGLTLAADPGLAMLMVVNEVSMLYQAERDKLTHPLVKEELQKKFNRYLVSRYGDRKKLKDAWKDSLAQQENPADGTVEIPMDYSRRKYSIERETDCRKFMAEIQSEYFREIRAHVRSLGCRAPITGSNHWTTDTLDFYSNSQDTDFIDRHAYWAHPVVDNGWGMEQILFNPNASVKSETGGLLEYIASRRVIGKPFTLTEWDNGSTNEFRADTQLYMPAYASMHGWHLFQFLFNMNRALNEPKRFGSSFDLEKDVLQLAMWPATATMFHRHDVRAADAHYSENFSLAEAAVPRGRNADVKKLARAGLRGVAGLNFHSEWNNASNPALVPTDNCDKIASITNELFWETRGLCRIDTPRTQAFTGFAPNESIKCNDVEFKTNNDFATVILTSRDNKPLRESGRILMTATARCWNTDMKFNRLRNRITAQGKAPIVFQPVEGVVKLRTDKPLDVYTINFSGKRNARLDCVYHDGYLTVPIGQSIHYELVEK